MDILKRFIPDRKKTEAPASKQHVEHQEVVLFKEKLRAVVRNYSEWLSSTLQVEVNAEELLSRIDILSQDEFVAYLKTANIQTDESLSGLHVVGHYSHKEQRIRVLQLDDDLIFHILSHELGHLISFYQEKTPGKERADDSWVRGGYKQRVALANGGEKVIFNDLDEAVVQLMNIEFQAWLKRKQQPDYLAYAYNGGYQKNIIVLNEFITLASERLHLTAEDIRHQIYKGLSTGLSEGLSAFEQAFGEQFMTALSISSYNRSHFDLVPLIAAAFANESPDQRQAFSSRLARKLNHDIDKGFSLFEDLYIAAVDN